MRGLKIPQPSIPDLVFGVLAVGIPLTLSHQLLNSDGDLGRHIRVGEYILSHGLLHRDIFSFTMLGAPFVGYEWLSEALTALAFRLGGLPFVAVCSSLVVALAYWVITRLLLHEGVEPFLAYLTAMVAAVIGSVHWLARPHLFTLLGVALVMFLLERGRSSGRRPIGLWSYVLLFALWANLHGGFLFGFIIIGAYAIGDLAEARISGDRARWLGYARRDLAALGAGAVGTLLTPYGIKVPLHVLGWFGNSYVIDHTGEYASPGFHDLTGKVILVVLLLMIGGLALSRRRPAAPRFLVILLTLATALIYQRNIPLLGLTALVVLALHIDPEWRSLPVLVRVRRTFERDAAGRRDGPWAAAVSVVLLLLTLGVSPMSRLHLIPGSFDPNVFPVLATEKARQAGLTGRIYNDFIWGGYLLFAWPEQKVFIDGQTDFYGESLTRTHNEIAGVNPGWRDKLAKWSVDLVMMPGQSSLAHELVREPAWSLWYCDSTAVILAKAARAPGVTADSAERRLFSCAPLPREPQGVFAFLRARVLK